MIFSTKAETLASLRGKVASACIPRSLHFSVAEWESGPEVVSQLLDRIEHEMTSSVAVRSSAFDEDSPGSSLAGRYCSRLHVPRQRAALLQAIQDVAKPLQRDPRNQILVQEMVLEVEVSGVLFTHDLSSGGPYYSVGYDDESGRTDSVTGGRSNHKVLLLHHDIELGRLDPPWLAAVLRMARELRSLFEGEPLDIEFARSRDGGLHLLQVRSLPNPSPPSETNRRAVSGLFRELRSLMAGLRQPHPNLSGNRSLFGLMPDWNPAELIGVEPSPLALSLFQALISDRVWSLARSSMGYREVNHPLLVVLAGRPYVDVRASFNSFLPGGLTRETETGLIDAWLERLAAHPEFHDKVEFEIAQTVVDPSFDKDFQSRYKGALTARRFHDYRRRLLDITHRNVSLASRGSLLQVIRTAGRVGAASNSRGFRRGPPDELLKSALRSLKQCATLGTLPFAVAARHAFIAEAILRSAVRQGGWDDQHLARFKRGIASVASRIRRDFGRVRQGEMDPVRFLRLYGHLRPGLFDILSPRYDQRPDLFEGVPPTSQSPAPSIGDVEIDGLEPTPLTRLLGSSGLRFSGRELIQYASLAIRSREWIKFRFSRCLSDALELLAAWGEGIGLSRTEVSWLTLADIDAAPPSGKSPVAAWRERIAQRRERAESCRRLRLGPLIGSERDLEIVSQPPENANFVTQENIVGQPFRLEGRSPVGVSLIDRIACVESADPGFDWLFSRGPAGLITKFGGSNSHMAIRCAEMSVPAAIGVGEGLFETLLQSTRIELRCRDRVVRPLDA